MDFENIKNFLIVVVLTCLIWITAEQAVTKSDQVRVRLQIPQSEGDTIIEFLDTDKKVMPENKLDVKLSVEGTTGRINQLAKLNSNLVDINTSIVDAVPEPGASEIVNVNVKTLLGGKFKIDDKNHFLLITDSTPQQVDLRVTRLVKKMVPVMVYHRGQRLSPEKVFPKEVEAYVVGSNTNEAIVELTDKQRLEATESEIAVKAVVFTPYRSPADFDVQVKISPIESVIPEREINSPRFGVLWPLALEGQYKVVIDENSPQFDEYKQAILCRGSKQQLDAYYDSPVHLMIVVTVEDLANIDTPIERIPIYNLPSGASDIEIINRKKSPIRFTIEKTVSNYQ